MLRLLIGALLCLTPALAQFEGFTFKCSTATLCVDRSVCDKNGVISPTPVTLTDDEELFRAPMVPCKIPGGGSGFCCRDPDYKDDWPSDYVEPGIPRPSNKGADETCPPPLIKLPNGKCGSKPTPRPPTAEGCKLPFVKLPDGSCGCKPPQVLLPNGKCGVVTVTPPRVSGCKPPLIQLSDGSCGCAPPLILLADGTCGCAPGLIRLPGGSCGNPPIKIKIPENIPHPEGDYESPGCPRRNRTAMPDLDYRPYVEDDVEAGAGEFSWQGAVYTTGGQFLCTCFLTFNSTCTTTASCVKNYQPSELKVAVGIYNIANPLGTKEPSGQAKNPQISACNYIAYDPKYDPASGKYDIALLHISNRVLYNYYTKAICLDDFYSIPFFNYDDCVVTGWGDGDTYHWADVTLLSESDCAREVPGFDPKAMSCARANHDACRLMEFGGGFQCRETGKRNKRSIDVYLLKGVYSAVKCGSNNPIITYSIINFDWFKEALYNPLKYPLGARR